ncbi:RidA family protein [Ureibacillus manganicus]|uniref:Uncharacterized protein n=1 Tax=Ureibacillus manganicus DSM 26584 TaxID=1384049 RepID=A0A0A3HYR3_9BACL|nr:RidA family protein [Ureibacillus manganicus]KGR77604.1 hypothetical protein CD29_14185 [Ureibacillus manganicus DSM 26584]
MEFITTKKAPEAIGPYSQAVKVNNMLYLSGQIPINPETGQVVENDIVLQTRQVLQNIEAILHEENLSIDQVVKTTIFIKDMAQFPIINEEYSSFFKDHKPARSTVEVSRLPKDVLIEIESIAVLS